MDLNCILSIVEGGMNHYQQHINTKSQVGLSNCSDRHSINMTLQDAELWQRFHEVTNEMIVTKSGRSVYCLFITPQFYFTFHIYDFTFHIYIIYIIYYMISLIYVILHHYFQILDECFQSFVL